jgi:hypothetical protein
VVVTDDQYRRDPGDARYWAEARTLSDLGELTARWLEGVIKYQPAWEGTWPDADMEPLVPVLVVANRGGFVTHFSQPGHSLALGNGQRRAAVSGFGTEEVILRLQSASLGTDLVILAYPPGGKLDGFQIPISISGGLVGIWAGAEMSPQAIQEYYGGDCHPDAIAALLGAWQATLIDPHWGRDDLLWPRLRAAVGDKETHPGRRGTPDPGVV